MYPKTHDYSNLLDELKSAYFNYFLDSDGILYNNNYEETNDEKAKAEVMFSMIYWLFFEKMYELKKGKENVSPNECIHLAFNDYNIFNSFMNICILEYQMYDDIGTGNTIYYPYEQMADFFFNEPGNKKVLKHYLDIVMEDIIKIQEGKAQKLLRK